MTALMTFPYIRCVWIVRAVATPAFLKSIQVGKVYLALRKAVIADEPVQSEINVDHIDVQIREFEMIVRAEISRRNLLEYA